MSGKVWVYGGANVDLVAQTPEFPRPGETRIGTSFATFMGGKGANQAVAAARLGAPTALIAGLGDDDFGRQVRHAMAQEGIDTDGLRTVPGLPTGTAVILIDGQGQNRIVVVLEANQGLRPEDVHVRFRRDTDYQLVQCEIPLETVHAVLRAAPERTILNPAPAVSLPLESLAGLLAVTPNETETEALTGIWPSDDASCHAAAQRLSDAGVQHVVLTLGERGVWWKPPASASPRHLPAPRVNPVDTTAAGDALNGALVAGLAHGMDFGGALGRAIRAAAISVTRPGAQASLPTLDDLGHEESPLR